MRFTRLSEIVTAIEAKIDPQFVEAQCLKRIIAVAEFFPARASDFFLFERCLGCDDSRVDFGVGVSERGAEWVVERPRWNEIAQIFAGSFRHVAAGPIRPWLEFDTAEPIDTAATPSVYVGVDPRTNDAASMLGLARELNRGDSTSFDAIARCVERFPPSVTRLYVGAMRSRGADGVRLNVAAIDDDDLCTYLRAIGWPGDLEPITALLARIGPVCKRFALQIDVESDIEPRLGIELIAGEPAIEGAASPYDLALLELLLRERLCSTLERTELARWPSQTNYTVPLIERLIDAAHPDPSERLFHGSLRTAIQHVKFAFAPDGSMRTKAYFGAILDSR